jgi:sulfate permease, SulP family
MKKRTSAIVELFPALRIARESTSSSLRRDFIAAVTVALFTIPQSMAYAIIAGVPPATGIWTGAIASILGAAFGSSEFVVNGPTNAISVLLAANAGFFAARGDPLEMIVLTTFLVGMLQIVAAALRLGSFTRFVSEPVLTGFTAGAGLYVAINQLPGILGLDKTTMVATIAGWKPPSNCVFDLTRTMLSAPQTNLIALSMGALTFLLVRALQRVEKKVRMRIPAPFVSIMIVTLISYALDLGEHARGAYGLKLIRDIQPLTRDLPPPIWPSFELDDLFALTSPVLALSILGAVEAIAIGKVLATRAGHTFSANRQLVGEGMCNLGAAMVGGFASSGSFTRSAVNFESGAETRLSCIFSGVLVLATVLSLAPVANYIPIAALAGTLVHIGLKLVNVSKLRLAMRTTKADLSVLLVTFIGVLLTEHLQYALFAGVAVSIVQALRRAEGFKLLKMVEDGRGGLLEEPLDESSSEEIVAIDLQGELFFAAADVLEARLVAILEGGTRFMVLRLAQSYNLDYTCTEVLANIAKIARSLDGCLILSGVRPGTYGTLERAGLLAVIGAENVFPIESEVLGSTVRALRRARSLRDERDLEGRRADTLGSPSSG